MDYILLYLLGGEITALDNLPNKNGVTSSNLTTVLYWVFAIGGLVAVGIIVYGGIKYQTSQGDPGKTKQASQILAYAIIGLVVVMLATAITAFVTGAIGEAAK